MHFLAFSAYTENSVASAKMKIFNLNTLLQKKKLSISTLMEEVKPKAMEKHEIGKRKKSKLL